MLRADSSIRGSFEHSTLIVRAGGCSLSIVAGPGRCYNTVSLTSYRNVISKPNASLNCPSIYHFLLVVVLRQQGSVCVFLDLTAAVRDVGGPCSSCFEKSTLRTDTKTSLSLAIYANLTSAFARPFHTPDPHKFAPIRPPSFCVQETSHNTPASVDEWKIDRVCYWQFIIRCRGIDRLIVHFCYSLYVLTATCSTGARRRSQSIFAAPRSRFKLVADFDVTAETPDLR